RALAFAIGDGALPSNEGRGYVLRRLLRRAVMHGQKLGIHKSFLFQLVPVVGRIMESYYPEILEQQEFIEKVIRNEEQRFHETINDGLAILEDLVEQVRKDGKDILAGADIFKLYDTYGFPVELTEEIAEESNLKLDFVGFEKEMAAQKERARSARSKEQSMGVQSNLLTDIKVASEYIGYTTLEIEAKLEVILKDETVVDQCSEGKCQLIFSKTPFYAEMGGQVADTGLILSQDGKMKGKVTDVQRAPNGQNLHEVHLNETLENGQVYV